VVYLEDGRSWDLAISISMAGLSPGVEGGVGGGGGKGGINGESSVGASVGGVNVDGTGEDHAPVALGPGAVESADGVVGKAVAVTHLFGHGGLDQPVGQDEAAWEGEGFSDLEIRRCRHGGHCGCQRKKGRRTRLGSVF